MEKAPPKDKVCAEFCTRFPSYRTDIPNSERVAFMLNHPLIRSKLNEWIGDNRDTRSTPHSPPPPSVSTKNKIKTNPNVNNRLSETEIQSHPTNSNANPHLKNPNHSLTQRELGNALFKQKKLYESLAAYNESIRHAPIFYNSSVAKSPPNNNDDNNDNDAKTLQIPAGEQELYSLSLANRSAVYFELGEKFYEKSLSDVDLALNYGYPDRLKSKLLVRKANIYVKSKQKWSEAESIIQEIQKRDDFIQKHLHPDALSKIKELESEIRKHLLLTAPPADDLSNSQSKKSNNYCDTETQCLNNDAVEFKENVNFAHASTGVSLNYSEKAGRFVVAAIDLKKKDVIFNEEPFASVLLPHFYESHCHHCHEILEHSHFIPCQQCSQCKFCSDNCASNAWNTYHKYECLSLDLLHSIGIAHLAIRIIFCAGLQNIISAIKNHKKLTDPKNISLFQKNGSNYERTYSLLNHLCDMNPEDMFQYTLTAGLLTNWMVKKTSFFHECNKEACQEEEGTTTYSETQVQVGAVVLHHISQLICNAHAITDILSDVNVDKVSLSTADESQQRIATAIFPGASMMNHSCDPNIAFTFKKGKTLQVKLTKDVTAGQEIFNCYGPHYRRMSFNARQESLNDQYFFQCTCHHCKTESLQNISFVDTFSSFKCEKCEGPVPSPQQVDTDNDARNQGLKSSCQSCGNEMDLNDQIRAFVYTDRLVQDAHVLLERGDVNKALPMFRTCEEQCEDFLYKYHSTLGELADVIGRCYAVLGEFSKAADFVKKSLIYVQERFGPESMEYGRELKKYVDLRSRSKIISDADELKQLSELYQSILL